ncbi:hypothetical protein Tco_0377620 [Tanacetum coccineum]
MFHPRPESPLYLPAEEHVLGYLKFSAKGTKREVFGMPIPNELIIDDIRGAQYYNAYLEKVAKHQRYLAGEEVSDPDSPAPKLAKATKPRAIKQSKPAPAKLQEKKHKLVKESSEEPPLTKRSKAGKVTKKHKPKSPLRLIDEFMDEGVPVNEPVYGDEEADTQRAIEASLREIHNAPRDPFPPVVIREPKSRKFQPLPEVSGKGKEKVGLSDSDTKSNKEVPHVVKSGAYDEGQAGPNPGDDEEPQPQSTPENLKLTIEEQVIIEEPASSTGTLSSLQHLGKDFSFGDQFFNDKPSEAENEKTTAETKAESMVSVIIHQDTFVIPPMTSSVIDLIFRPDSPNIQRSIPIPATTIATTTTTTTTRPLPPQAQQSTPDSILIKRIGELEQHMADLVEAN